MQKRIDSCRVVAKYRDRNQEQYDQANGHDIRERDVMTQHDA